MGSVIALFLAVVLFFIGATAAEEQRLGWACFFFVLSSACAIAFGMSIHS